MTEIRHEMSGTMNPATWGKYFIVDQWELTDICQNGNKIIPLCTMLQKDQCLSYFFFYCWDKKPDVQN